MACTPPLSGSDKSEFDGTLFQTGAARLVGLQDEYTSRWHREPPDVPAVLGGFEKIVVEQHLSNFQLWHAEDAARAPGASDRDLAGIKRFIDKTNQRRNDLAEQCDSFLLACLKGRCESPQAGELHSETPGLMIDRLSILALKLFHTFEEIHRRDSPAGHTELNRERLVILTEQREDLAQALDRLWTHVLSGERHFKLYRQLKMYNDPSLNPAVYGAERFSG